MGVYHQCGTLKKTMDINLREYPSQANKPAPSEEEQAEEERRLAEERSLGRKSPKYRQYFQPQPDW